MSVMNTSRVKAFDSFAGFGCLILIMLLASSIYDGCTRKEKPPKKPNVAVKGKP